MMSMRRPVRFGNFKSNAETILVTSGINDQNPTTKLNKFFDLTSRERATMYTCLKLENLELEKLGLGSG